MASQVARAVRWSAYIYRSAEQAGFFRGSKTRLQRPPIGNGVELIEPNPAEEARKDTEKQTSLADSPLLAGLWVTLPKTKPFTAEARRRFFTTLAFNIDYVYGEPEDGKFDPSVMMKLWTVDPVTPPGAGHGSG